MTYAITGASGTLGRLAADYLLKKVPAEEVVLITRRPESLADYAARGAVVRAGDFTEPDGLAAAFAGVERLLLISTDAVEERVAGHRAAIDAAVAAGVRHIAYTSVPEPTPDNPALVVADHAATEAALRDSGIHYTALRNNLYADLQSSALQQAAQTGQLVTNSGSGSIALVTRDDCAAAAVGALLLDPEQTRSFDITGPEALSTRDLADLASELGDRPVEVVDLDDETYTNGLISAGLPAEIAPLLASFGTATRQGYLASVSTAVEELTGRRPTRLADLLASAGQQPA